MLIPAKDGHYYVDDHCCIDYHAFVDILHRVIECYTLEDNTQWVFEHYWTDMNDIEKFVCRQRGWNLDQYYPDILPTGKPLTEFDGKKVYDFRTQFLENGTYIEKFYTEDKGPYYLGMKFNEWTPDIFEKALSEGIIGPDGNLINREETLDN